MPFWLNLKRISSLLRKGPSFKFEIQRLKKINYKRIIDRITIKSSVNNKMRWLFSDAKEKSC